MTSSLTACLKKAGPAINSEDRAAILARSRELRGEGVSAHAAAKQAVEERLEGVKTELNAAVRGTLKKVEPAANDVPAPDQGKAAAARSEDSAQRRSDDRSSNAANEASNVIRKARGMPVADVERIVTGLTASWKDKPQVTVVATAADLPGDNPPDSRGMYQGGHVWIVAGASEHVSKADIARTLAHEAIAHYGLRKMLGREAWTRLMRDIQLGVKANNKALTAISEHVRKTYVDENGKFELSAAEEADEIAAKAVEDAIDEDGNFRPGFAFLKAAFAKVAQFLREHGIDVTFTNAELQGMLVLSMRNMERGERTAGGGRMVVGGATAARALGQTSVADVLLELGQRPDLYQIPRSDKKSLGAIAKDKGLTAEVVDRNTSNNTEWMLANTTPRPDTGAHSWVVRTPTGGIATLTDDHGRVYINVSAMKEGDGGRTIYDLAANYALTNGKVFIGDPNGVSPAAMRRRLENMLSSAIKYGTTEHLQPHQDQVAGRPDIGVPPLEWHEGDTAGNIQRMVEVSVAATADSNPIATDNVVFDPATQSFRDRNGDELDAAALRSLLEFDGRGRRAGSAGDATLRRNALFRALLSGVGARRAQMAAVRAEPNSGKPGTGGAFDGAFYARGGVSDSAFDGAQNARGTTADTEQDTETEAPVTGPTSPWRDATGRMQFAPGAWLYEKLGTAAGPLLSKLQLKAASPTLRRALRDMKLQVQKAQETAAAVAGEAMKLTEAERGMVSDLIEQELAAGTVPPEHAVRLAAMINTSMGAQTDELVRLGMLTAESADLWRGKYLPRYYKNKLGKQVGDAWADAMQGILGRPKTMAGIKGKHLKGRGLYETVPERELANWEALGWEVRDPDFQPGLTEDGTVQVWRDFSRSERDNMGEIRDAGFRFVMGYMQTQRDIALGRMFEQLAVDPEMSGKREAEAFAVHVPDGTVPGTGAKRYGKLAGRWVSKDTMSHLTQIEESQSEAWRMYRKALAIWKEGKTALNPVSHVNNIVSNLTMAHFAGVSYLRADKYIAAARDFATKSEGIAEAKEAGLFLGTMSDAELMNVLPEDLKALVKQQDSAAKKVGSSAFNVMTFFLRRPMGWAYQAEDTFFRYLIYKDARGRGVEPGDAVDYAQKYIFSYDDLPKGARMIRDFGVPFFSYTYKAIPALLHTALTHPVRMAAPAAVLWGINAAAYAIAAGDDDDDWLTKLQKYVTDSDYRAKAREKEKLEREHLPPWMKGYTSLGTPKTIRLGTDELTKLPLFIDTSRIIPGGDLFDVNPNAGGIPWLQPFTPSNPLLTTYMAMFGNRDSFFGKDLVDSNDTRGEAALKRADWLWKQASPAIALGNYHFERGMNALAQATGSEVRWLPEAVAPDAVATGVGRDGLPVQPKYAAAQTFGVKVRPLDLDTAEAIDGNMRNKMIRDIEAEMRSLRRLNQKGAISDSVYDRKRDKATEKKDRIRDGLTVDGDQKD